MSWNNTIVGRYPALQTQPELDRFIAILRNEKIRSYCEIGSKFGGSLWLISNSLPKGARIVSVDIAPRVELERCINELADRGYDAHLIVGDSQAAATIAEVAKLAPFDCLMIDGDHRMPVPRIDWENYGHMARIVAFHDIAYKHRSGRPEEQIEVPQQWQAVKSQFRHEEIIGNDMDYHGIGVLWRA